MTEYRIIRTEEEARQIADAWRTLYAKTDARPFACYDFFNVWWQTIGKGRGANLFVVTAWRGSELVALLPLAIYKKGGMRLLRWAAHSVYFSSLSLAIDEDEERALWEIVRKSKEYDFTEMTAIWPGSVAEQCLKSFPRSVLLREDAETYVVFDETKGAGWFNRLRTGRRKEIEKHIKALEKKAQFSFTVYQESLPQDVLENLIRHKLAWCARMGLSGPAFENSDFVRALAKTAVEKKCLYLACTRCGENQIGFDLGITGKNKLHALIMSFDYAYAKYGPGLLTSSQGIKWAGNHGFDEFNFMEGRTHFKASLADQQRPHLVYGSCRSLRGMMGLFLLKRQHKKRAENEREKLQGAKTKRMLEKK